MIAIDSELSERVYDQQFAPRLEAAGVEVVSYNTIDPTDSTSFNNDQLQAIINFREAGVDKVVAIGGSRLVSWFIDTSITQNFAPAYALTSYDAPDFNAFNYPEMMPGASGISVLPGYDIEDDQLAFPASAASRSAPTSSPPPAWSSACGPTSAPGCCSATCSACCATPPPTSPK